MEIEIGLRGSTEHVVSTEDTAIALGSGDVDVLGTPRLIAWLEGATVAAAASRMAADLTSVGTRVDVRHKAASVVGVHVRAEATLVESDGRTLRFEVSAHDADGTLLATGEITRAIVPRSRFRG